MKVPLPTTAILPFIRRAKTALTASVIICSRAAKTAITIKGRRSSLFSPVRSRSMKNREKMGLMMPYR